MTLKDRTTEFNGVLELLRAKKNSSSNKLTHTPPSTISTPKRDTKLLPKSEFALIAGQIGKDIAETADKLEKLTKCMYVR